MGSLELMKEKPSLLLEPLLRSSPSLNPRLGYGKDEFMTCCDACGFLLP